MKSVNIIRWAGIVLMVLGLGLTAWTWRIMPEKTRHLNQKISDLKQLRELQAEFQQDMGAIEMFEKLQWQTPPSLRELSQQVTPSLNPEIRERAPMTTEKGWTLRQTEVMISSAPFSEVGRFVLTAENQRPPWKLIECNFTASEEDVGRGRATLVFEALEKKKE